MKRRHVNKTAWAEAILDRQPFSQVDADAITAKVKTALVLILDGKADPVHFITLGCAINVASVRAEEISPELVSILAAAGEAMAECQRIHDQHGRYGLTGPGRHALSAGVDAYDDILRASSPKQMQLAEREVLRRLGMLERKAA